MSKLINDVFNLIEEMKQIDKDRLGLLASDLTLPPLYPIVKAITTKDGKDIPRMEMFKRWLGSRGGAVTGAFAGTGTAGLINAGVTDQSIANIPPELHLPLLAAGYFGGSQIGHNLVANRKNAQQFKHIDNKE